jgi:C4-dicarboxylate-specific signal transduction histidine kinase
MIDATDILNGKILIVDDEETNILLLERALRRAGYASITSTMYSGQVCELHRIHRYDLILLDLQMPGMDGFQVMGNLKAFETGGYLPVLVVTARPDHKLRALKAGAKDFVSKPLDLAEVLLRVHNMLEVRLLHLEAKTLYDRVVAEQKGSERLHALATRSRDNLQRLLESIPDIVVMTRLDGSVAFVNEPGQRLLSIAPGAPISTGSILPAEHPIVSHGLAAPASGRDPVIATVHVPSNGGMRECELSALRVEFDGQPAIVTVGRDVTDRREIDRRLALAERMATVGTLAAGVAHEINNPLSYILSNLRFLSSELARFQASEPEKLAEASKATAETLEGAERVRRIVQDLRTFACDGEGRAPVDLHRVLDLAISNAASQIRVRAKLVKDYEHIPQVQGDESRLGRVALNLLVNAAQAISEGRCPDDNEIRVVTRPDSAGRVLFEIRDTGCGIPPESMNRVFEPFFTTKPVGAGTGLGLSICHAIVTSMGGEITVRSEVGQGTVFRVVLPTAAEPGVTALEDDAPLPDVPRAA